MRPRPVVEPGVGRRFLLRCNRQRGSEGAHWPEPAVEAEHKLVEVRLQVLRAHAMVDTQQPCIEVSEDDVDHG